MDGPEVKRIREALCVSQAVLAVALGVSRRTVEEWEQGRRCPKEDNEKALRELDANKGKA